MTSGCTVRFGGFMVLLSVVLLGIPQADAADVTLSTADTIGTSSFDNNGANNWSDGLDPSAGNDYFVGLEFLRTPPDSVDYTFAGDSLTLLSGGAVICKATGSRTVNANWIMDGGYIRSGAGSTQTITIGGTMDIASTGSIWADQSPYVLSATLSGSGNLSLTSGYNINVTGTSTMTGDILANGSDLDWGTTSSWLFSIGSSGVNNTISGTGNAFFDGVFNFDLTGASSTPGDSWTIAGVATQSFGSNFSIGTAGFSQSGSVWTNGTYTFNPNTGILAVAAPPIEWAVDADGNWTAGTNWTGGSAPATDGDALLGAVITANRTVTLDTSIQLNSITFSNTGDGDYFVVNNGGGEKLTLTGEGKVDAQAGRHWLRAEVAGTVGLNATGGGELVLDAANSFSGGLSVDNTNLGIVNTNALPTGSNITVANNGEVRFWGPNNAFFIGQGSAGYGTGTVAGAISIDATSQLEVNDGADVTFSGGIANNGSFEANSGSTVAVSSAISGTGTVNAVDGDLTLSVANSYTGVTNVGAGNTGGTLTITNGSALGAADGTAATRTAIGGNESTATLVLSGGIAVGDEVLAMAAREGAGSDAPGLSSTNGSNSWAGNIRGAFGGQRYNIESADPSGTLTLSGIISAEDSAVRNFVFSGPGDTVVSGKITDLATDANGDPVSPSTNAVDAVSVYKQGAGTLYINTKSSLEDDYWQVATVIEEGTLVVNSDGSNQGELWSSTINVKAGATLDIDDFGLYNLQPAQNLGGAGTVVASTLGVWDDNSLTPGDSVGTLTINGTVTLNAGGGGSGVLNYELGNTTTVGGSQNDLIQINGPLSTSGTPSMTVNVTPVKNALATGSYRLINHSGGTTSFGGVTAQVVNAVGNPLTVRQSLSVSGATRGR